MKQVQNMVPGWFATMIVASAAICVVGLSQPQNPPQEPALSSAQTASEVQNAKELYDVLWIDRYPEMASDTFKGYTFTSDNVGIAMDFHSAYKLTLELFEFKATNTQLTFHFPHDGRRAQNPYKIEKLKKPTKHFDISLTLENDPTNGGKTTIYYSGPNFRSLHHLPSPIAETLHNSGVMQHVHEAGE